MPPRDTRSRPRRERPRRVVQYPPVKPGGASFLSLSRRRSVPPGFTVLSFGHRARVILATTPPAESACCAARRAPNTQDIGGADHPSTRYRASHPAASSSTLSSPRATMITSEPCPARPVRTGELVRSPALPPRSGQFYRAQRKPRLSAQLVGSSPARRVDSTRSGWVSLQPPPRLTRRGSAQRSGEVGLTLAGAAG